MSMLKNVAWVEKLHRLFECTLISFKCQSIRSKVHCTNKTLHNESLKKRYSSLGSVCNVREEYDTPQSLFTPWETFNVRIYQKNIFTIDYNVHLSTADLPYHSRSMSRSHSLIWNIGNRPRVLIVCTWLDLDWNQMLYDPPKIGWSLVAVSNFDDRSTNLSISSRNKFLNSCNLPVNSIRWIVFELHNISNWDFLNGISFVSCIWLFT